MANEVAGLCGFIQAGGRALVHEWRGCGGEGCVQGCVHGDMRCSWDGEVCGADEHLGKTQGIDEEFCARAMSDVVMQCIVDWRLVYAKLQTGCP